VFPFVAAGHGLSLAAIGGIVATAIAAQSVKILWMPVVDLVGTLRKWSALGSMISGVLIVALVMIPATPANVGWLMLTAFACNTAAQAASVAASGLLALTVEEQKLGAASGYFQGGQLVSQGLCGAGGLWLATHVGIGATAAVFGLASLVPAMATLLIADPGRTVSGETLRDRFAAIGRDVVEMARVPRRRYVMLAFLTPIGVGGSSYLFAAIAPEWHAGADMVALVTGLGAAFASAIGAFLYGRFVDGLDRVSSFLMTGVILAAMALLLAVLPRAPLVFASVTMLYAFALGFSYTAFTALQFETVGKGAAASKACILNALGNAPVSYMPALLGWVHDRGSSGAMLWVEIVLTLMVIFAVALFRPRAHHIPAQAVTA